MRLTVKKGQDYKTAFQNIIDFLDNNNNGYQYLSKDLNIYINLANNKSQIHPDSKKHFVITSEGVQDVQEIEFDNARKMLLDKAIEAADDKIKYYSNLPKAYEKESKAYQKCIDKGFKTAGLHKQKAESLQREMENMDTAIAYWNTVKDLLTNGTAIFFSMVRFIESGQPYVTNYIRGKLSIDLGGENLPKPVYFYGNGYHTDDTDNEYNYTYCS